jgi:hypothetical protein
MNIATATTATLPKLVALCVRNRLVVVLLALLIAAGSIFATAHFLGVTTDTGTMFSANLPWKQRSAELAKLFPQNDKLIVAVIDGKIPEEAEATASALAQALRQDHTHFTMVSQPDALPDFSKNAFLLSWLLIRACAVYFPPWGWWCRAWSTIKAWLGLHRRWVNSRSRWRAPPQGTRRRYRGSNY